MPYTPPSQRSPAASVQASPDASRRPSLQSGSSRPSLPRSASYLTRHRRTPAASATSDHTLPQEFTPEATFEDLQGMTSNTNVRQSPPPVTNGKGMPKGAILSPPESSTSSDDDDMLEVRGRRIENLKELHDAISQIPQHREASPDKTGAVDLLVLPSQVNKISADGIRLSMSTGALDSLAAQQRRISHARSATEPNAVLAKSPEASITGSDDESDEEEVRRKPQMVRKKSGELVRPALRPPSRRRPSSMPGTPTFSKMVHFDSHLEHVRHFLQVDRPLAVSAGSSPADNYDSDNEYPFHDTGNTRSPPHEWELVMANFPVDTPVRKALPVRLERVWLSNDQKFLLGSIAVANLAFQKHVVCRFTLDYWKTTSELAAEFVSEIRPKETTEGQDRFQFSLKLADLANLESKTLFFCIKYTVNGQEHWDNNGGPNFQVDFRKKMLPQNGKRGTIGAASRSLNGLPRSGRRSSASPSGLRPKPASSPASDEFGDGKVTFDQSIHEYLGESNPTSLRLKVNRSAANLPSDNLPSRLAAPSGQAFANRYDFGASLTAAMQAARDGVATKPEALYMKPPLAKSVTVPADSPKHVIKELQSTNGPTTPTPAPHPITTTVKAQSQSGPGNLSPSIASSSYEELVNKYCFFGSSKQSSPQIKDGTLQSGRYDGPDDGTRSTNSTLSSSNGSPIQMGSSRAKDTNPYFTFGHSKVGASPSESPLRLTAQFERISNSSSGQPRTVGESTGKLTSSVPATGGLLPFAGTSPHDFAFEQHLHDRFPFTGADTYTSTAIRG